MASQDQEAADREGFIFASTGKRYVNMARRAARTLRQVMPDAKIDLFTSEPLDDAVFDRVHLLDRDWHRPKMEALRRSRFARTIYLDADVMVLSDVSDLFALLDRFDMAAVFDPNRSPRMLIRGDKVPRAFTVVNSGVIALRASDATAQFMRDWEDDMTRAGEKIDQPSLLRLLYASDLRFAALPVEYNVKDLGLLRAWPELSGAPRILHQSKLSLVDHNDPTAPYALEDLLSDRLAERVRILLNADWDAGSLTGKLMSPLKRKVRKAFAQVSKRGPKR